MTKLFLLTVTMLISFATYAKEDSLIAKIGKKAKVVFYTENPEDLKEIGKYDLNLLFKELRKRSEKNFSLSEEVSLKEADDLKNRESNTTVTPKKWFRNMNLNIFTGVTMASVHRYRSGIFGAKYKAHFMGPVCNCSDDGFPYASIFKVHSESASMFGIGGYYDKLLKVKSRKVVSLRYGFGLDFITTKIILTEINRIPLRFSVPSIPGSYINNQPTRKIHSSNFFTELQPTINFTNKKGQQSFRIGLGVKLALSLNNISGEKIMDNYLSITNSPYLGIKYKPVQTALTGTFGYKYVSLFVQIAPNNIQIADINNTNYTYTLPIDSPRQINGTNYIIGLRFGK
ncbi:hypothetical protein [Emticicia agri]|uniref:Outer membrane protein beta-barrel domain-containing protein n=1 Tax=Emticicia agri TaxID=2492393 RepID=A0A4Q5LTX6_9BACT|nr:hypothetical protein [Emticicia agri]RYU92929.1 hypothetical protein EWM59_24670 [Emticicia agri]